MDFVEQVKSSVDIVDVVRQYVHPLRKAGTRWVGLCPFHNEKSASFGVHATHQFYKCFGCGAGGDVIKFVMEIEGLTFWETLKMLAEQHGIPMPKRAEYSDDATKLREAIYRIHDIAVDLYRNSRNREIQSYLAKRGVTDATADEFGLGYSDRGGQALVQRLKKDFSPEQLEKSGLVRSRPEGGFYDYFRGRLMFPIHGESGQVIAFGGRAMADGEEPKYLNSPATEVYDKSRTLYNLHRAKSAVRKLDRSILVEGYMDVIGVFASGIKEVVASCGTSLTRDQVRILKRHSQRVVINYDPDTAGENAAEKAIAHMLDESMQVRILALDGGLDPDEYIKNNGAEAYREKLDKAGGYFHWLADRARMKYDMREAEGRMDAFRFLLPAIQRIPDKLERAAVAQDVADYLKIERGLVLDQFRRMAVDKQQGQRATPAAAGLPHVEQMLLHHLLAHPEVRVAAVERLREMAAVERMKSRRILSAIIVLTGHKPEWTFSDLEARLEDNDRNLLIGIVSADEIHESVEAEVAVGACLRALEFSELDARIADLRARIKGAEQAGNMTEALRLYGELDGLTKPRAGGGPISRV